MVTGLDEFTKEHEYLICVDSDGCAMDTMNCKHLQCFGPCMVAEFGLDARRAEWLARWNEINLYSMTRGINRFKALALILEEADAGGTKIDGVQDLRSWTDTAPELSEKTAEAMYAKTGQPIFAKALAWSRAVNKAIAALPKTQVAAFPGAAQALGGRRPRRCRCGGGVQRQPRGCGRGMDPLRTGRQCGCDFVPGCGQQKSLHRSPDAEGLRGGPDPDGGRCPRRPQGCL